MANSDPWRCITPWSRSRRRARGARGAVIPRRTATAARRAGEVERRAVRPSGARLRNDGGAEAEVPRWARERELRAGRRVRPRSGLTAALCCCQPSRLSVPPARAKRAESFDAVAADGAALRSSAKRRRRALWRREIPCTHREASAKRAVVCRRSTRCRARRRTARRAVVTWQARTAAFGARGEGRCPRPPEPRRARRALHAVEVGSRGATCWRGEGG